MFDKIINFFKEDKGQPKVDHKVKDLEVGYILEYNLQTWVVEKEYNYNWGEGYYSKEWLISSGAEKLLLFYDDSEEEEEISISKEVSALQGLNDIREEIINRDVPRNSFAFDGKKWLLTSENPCLFSEKGKSGTTEMVMWIFDDEEKDEFISFSRTGEKNINAYRGSYLKEFEIDNILPSEKK